ncbi:unnamed protein product [Chrysodeixis includens]|uniref:Uncharacterized protein n=1 Tax=Chrysodeixis includens TaxID=689277 RepID=A0A9N8PY05_CHRIL|nr:unnamed protein product [Chrysodeixis includens]
MKQYAVIFFYKLHHAFPSSVITLAYRKHLTKYSFYILITHTFSNLTTYTTMAQIRVCVRVYSFVSIHSAKVQSPAFTTIPTIVVQYFAVDLSLESKI